MQMREFTSVVFAVLTALKIADLLTWSWLNLLIYVFIISVMVGLLDQILPLIKSAGQRWLTRRRLRRHF